jgi:hypothetical protein
MDISALAATTRFLSSTRQASVQLKLIKIGAKVVSHPRRTVFQMAVGGGARGTVPKDPCPYRVPGYRPDPRQPIMKCKCI